MKELPKTILYDSQSKYGGLFDLKIETKKQVMGLDMYEHEWTTIRWERRIPIKGVVSTPGGSFCAGRSLESAYQNAWKWLDNNRKRIEVVSDLPIHD